MTGIQGIRNLNPVIIVGGTARWHRKASSPTPVRGDGFFLLRTYTVPMERLSNGSSVQAHEACCD